MIQQSGHRASQQMDPPDAADAIADAEVPSQGATAVSPAAFYDDLPDSGGDLFEGDAGDLPIAVRRALTALLSRPYVSAMSEPDIFETVMRETPDLRRELANLGLVLTVSDRYEVAFATQAPVEGASPLRVLKRSSSLPRDVTLLLISLRARQHADEARGEENWFVDREDMEDLLRSGPYAQDRDGKRVAMAVNGAIERVKELGYIRPVEKTQGRYRIMPILPATFTLERTREMLEAFRSLLGEANDGDALSPDAESRGDEQQGADDEEEGL